MHSVPEEMISISASLRQEINFSSSGEILLWTSMMKFSAINADSGSESPVFPHLYFSTRKISGFARLSETINRNVANYSS